MHEDRAKSQNFNMLLTWAWNVGHFIYPDIHVTVSAWWRHQMETSSALVALCAGNSPVPVISTHKGQWRGGLMFSLIYAWINDWVNREAGDLRRHRGHYDVNVMESVDLSIDDVILQPRVRPSLIQLLNWQSVNQICPGQRLGYAVLPYTTSRCPLSNLKSLAYLFPNYLYP